MTDIPKICVFKSDDAPAEQSRVAFFYVPRKGGGLERLPVVFHGRSEEAVRAAAERFWIEEQAKAAEPRGRVRK